MGLYMRAIVRDWHEPSFEEPAAFVAARSPFRVKAAGERGWFPLANREAGERRIQFVERLCGVGSFDPPAELVGG